MTPYINTLMILHINMLIIILLYNKDLTVNFNILICRMTLPNINN